MIAIIAILAGLLIVAAAAAIRTAKRTRIVAEMEQFNTAIEDYKNNVGSYPPNTQTDGVAATASRHLDNERVLANFERHLKKAFPQHREPAALLKAICGFDPNNAGDVVFSGSPDGTALLGGMNAAEAVVFWLGGFSDDPKYPISGSGGPSYSLSGISVSAWEADPIDNRLWLLEVDVTELGPRNDANFFNQQDGRFIVYADPRNPGQQRRINFWYLRAPGTPAPYVYFDASRGASATADNDPPAAVIDETNGQYSDAALRGLYNVVAVKRLKSESDPDRPFQFANDGKFQFLHAGLDERWGSFPLVDPMDATRLIDADGYYPAGNQNVRGLLFPEGPWTLDLADTLASFAGGTLEDAQP